MYVSISSPKTLGMGRHFHSVLCCAIDAKFVGLVPCKPESKLMMGYSIETQAIENKQANKQQSGNKKGNKHPLKNMSSIPESISDFSAFESLQSKKNSSHLLNLWQFSEVAARLGKLSTPEMSVRLPTYSPK